MKQPICVECGRIMRCSKNGFFVHVLDSRGGPYQIWSADKWQCSGCGREVVVGFGNEPIAEYYEPGFSSWLPRVALEVRS
jgi:hypothetical protein